MATAQELAQKYLTGKKEDLQIGSVSAEEAQKAALLFSEIMSKQNRTLTPKEQLDERIANRTDSLSEGLSNLDAAGQSLKQFYSPKTSMTDRALALAKYYGSAGAGALQTVGGAFQRAEAAVANPIMELMRGKPEEAIPSIGRGLKGEQLTEAGDVARRAGAPEPLAAILGLVATSPGVAVSGISAARKAVLKGIGKLTAKTGVGATRNALTILQKTQPEITDFLIADKFKAAGSKYYSMEAGNKIARDLAAQTKKYIYKPANKAFEHLKVKSADKLVANIAPRATDVDEITTLTGKLQQFLGSEVGAADEGKRVLDAIKKLTEGDDTLKTVYGIQRSLRRTAGKNYMDAEAVRIIGDHLASQFDEFVDASNKWARWAAVSRSQQSILGKPVLSAKNRVSFKAAALKDYFNPNNATVRVGLNDLQSVLQDVSAGKTKDILTEVKRYSAIQNFRDLTPGFKALTINAMLGLGSSATAGPIAAGAATGAGLVAGSPKASVGLFRSAYAASDKIKSLQGKPIMQTLDRLNQTVTDPAILRLITGRGLED